MLKSFLCYTVALYRCIYVQTFQGVWHCTAVRACFTLEVDLGGMCELGVALMMTDATECTLLIHVLLCVLKMCPHTLV